VNIADNKEIFAVISSKTGEGVEDMQQVLLKDNADGEEYLLVLSTEDALRTG